MSMLDNLKMAGKNIGRELSRTWENLSDGWRELLSRGSNALTHFSFSKDEAFTQSGSTLATFPRWSLLAGEVEELDKEHRAGGGAWYGERRLHHHC
jgi:HSP20 family protein